MFTGIIQDLGKVEAIETVDGKKENPSDAGGKTFTLSAPSLPTAKIGSSRSVEGVCTTVISTDKDRFSFFASKETLAITSLQWLNVGDEVNLETSMKLSDGIDGHIVSGHVEKMVQLIGKTEGESWILRFALAAKDMPYLIEKGSVALAGISLTVYKLYGDETGNPYGQDRRPPRSAADGLAKDDRFAKKNHLAEKATLQHEPLARSPFAMEMMIIPHTYKHTSLKHRKVGDWVNIEFDMLAKYAAKQLQGLWR